MFRLLIRFPGFCLPLNGRHICIAAVLALAVSFVSAAPAADTPAESLRRQFESAKGVTGLGDAVHGRKQLSSASRWVCGSWAIFRYRKINSNRPRVSWITP